MFLCGTGTKEYLTAGEFRRTVRRNFGIMNEEWVKKYFKAFDRNHRRVLISERRPSVELIPKSVPSSHGRPFP